MIKNGAFIKLSTSRLIKFLKNRSIINKIIFSFILITVCLFSFFYFIVYQNYYSSTLNQTQKLANQFYQTVNFKIGLLVNQVFSCSNKIADENTVNKLIVNFTKENNPIIKEEIKTSIINELSKILVENQEILNINLYINNEHIYINNRNYSLIGEYLLKTEYYQKAYSNDKKGYITSVPTYTQNYSYLRSDGSVNEYSEKVISFIRPISNDDIRIIMAIDYTESHIANYYNNLKLTANTFSLISNKEGDIISSNEKDYIGQNLNNFGSALEHIENYYGSAKIEFDKNSYNMFYNTFYLLNWNYIDFVPKQELILDELKNTFYIFICFYFLSTTFMAFLVFRLVSKPLKDLLKGIIEVKNEDFSSRIKVKNQDEIGRVKKHFNEMIDNIETLLKENYIIKLQEKEAEIKMLQAQINPHFLYNILDIISWKAMLNEVDDIKNITIYLGEFLRYCINDYKKMVSVEEDLKQVRNYIAIQKIRYTNRFNAYFNIDDTTKDLKIPKLLIQPIVENAIKHGLADKEISAIIYIKTKIYDNNLYVYVIDNGCGISQKKIDNILSKYELIYKDNKIHVGIKNVNERIKILSDKEYGIMIKSSLGRYTKVTIKLPVISA